MQKNNIPSFKQYLVEEEREIFFTFGRMNPPTVGHGKLMDMLSSKAGRNPYKVFLAQGQDAKKNPLSYSDKIKHIRKMFPKHGRNVLLNKKVKTVFDALVNLYDQGFKRITMVVGEDRVTEFKILLEKYNGTKARHGFYNFERIQIISAGQRDPDSEGVEGMSASKQRANAKDNDFSSFSQGLPKSLSNKDAKKLFNDVRVGMGLKESVDFKQHVDLGQLSETREKYIAGELFEPGDRVVIKESNQSGYIYRLGANYVIVALDEGRVSRQWLDGIVLENTDKWYKDQPEWGTPASTKKAKKTTPGESTEVPQDKDISKRSGSQPSKYHKGLSKATKIARDRAVKKMYGEGKQIDLAKDKISREKEADKVKHDSMLDRARSQDVRAKNKATNPTKEASEPSKNPVAKYARKFNKATVQKDRKKADKRGYIKHKGKKGGLDHDKDLA
jgi:hypothetical protein